MQKELSKMTIEEMDDYMVSVILSEKLSLEEKGAELHRIYEEGIVLKAKQIAKKYKSRPRVPAYDDWLWQVRNIRLKGRI